MANQVLYGFHSIQDLARQRVNDNITVVSDAIQQAVAEHERQMRIVMDLFVMRTTEHQLRFKTVSQADLQPLDEFGRARPIQIMGNYTVGWPLQKAGLAWGVSREARAKLTVQDAQDLTSAFISADWRWIRKHILAALYTDADWSYTDDQYGALTIKGLANGDSVVYNLLSGADSGGTANHFLKQAAAIADITNPYPTIYDTLMKRPENGGKVICLIPTNLKATTKGLADFHDQVDPNLNLGANATVLTGQLGVEVPGEVIGYVDKCWIVEWPTLPDNYIIALTTDGAKPLAMREHPEAELQGFAQVAKRMDHPFEETHWEHIAGFGAWNRVGALVYRIGNASYAIPTNYGPSPIP